MKKLGYSIFIKAPIEKVWNTMLGDSTYRIWTKTFNPTSYFEGNWEKGSEMKFLGTNEKGEVDGGMASRIAENRKHEYISIEHYGMIKKDGTVDTESDEVKKWTPSFENYTFEEADGGTLLRVDMDVAEGMEDEFNKMWPKALDELKRICEE